MASSLSTFVNICVKNDIIVNWFSAVSKTNMKGKSRQIIIKLFHLFVDLEMIYWSLGLYISYFLSILAFSTIFQIGVSYHVQISYVGMKDSA